MYGITLQGVVYGHHHRNLRSYGCYTGYDGTKVHDANYDIWLFLFHIAS